MQTKLATLQSQQTCDCYSTVHDIKPLLYFSIDTYYEALPQTKPLKNLVELFEWAPDPSTKAVIPLRKRHEVKNQRTLVCHDMKGGYLSDK